MTQASGRVGAMAPGDSRRTRVLRAGRPDGFNVWHCVSTGKALRAIAYLIWHPSGTHERERPPPGLTGDGRDGWVRSS
ncbi:hypothetical protein GCM10010232_52730 [Streptomyces amakusaensis]